MDLVFTVLLSILIFFIFLLAGFFLAFLWKRNFQQKQIEKNQIAKTIFFKNFLINLKETLLFFSKKKIGALIILVNKEDITPYLFSEGLFLDAVPSTEIFKNIFMNKKNELHDGAVTIDHTHRISYVSVKIAFSKTKKIFSAAQKSLQKNFGTRHFAALYLAQQTNALVLAVSESTGKISFFSNKEITVVNTKLKLKTVMNVISNYWNEK